MLPISFSKAWSQVAHVDFGLTKWLGMTLSSHSPVSPLQALGSGLGTIMPAMCAQVWRHWKVLTQGCNAMCFPLTSAAYDWLSVFLFLTAFDISPILYFSYDYQYVMLPIAILICILKADSIGHPLMYLLTIDIPF